VFAKSVLPHVIARKYDDAICLIQDSHHKITALRLSGAGSYLSTVGGITTLF